ncbi:hypothetical protein [Bradyrhizobium sp. WSM3983]|uniref:hypothetical protein n=1 Tax=Bradyrhizobium sp. WSM3983 TaxID=1038867 RepID=UPI00041E7918|nr:hypothetical protein [Bradyrhizobium sp. WSM3983]
MSEKTFFTPATRITVFAHASDMDSSGRIDALAMTAIKDGSRDEANGLFHAVRTKYMGMWIGDWRALPNEVSWDE